MMQRDDYIPLLRLQNATLQTPHGLRPPERRDER